MNFIDIYLFNDIRLHIFDILTNTDKFILNLVCKLTYTGIHKANYIRYICKRNYINLLQYVIEMVNLKHIPAINYSKMYKYAIKYAQFDILNFGFENIKFDKNEKLGEHAAKYGHISVLSWLYSRNLIEKTNAQICAYSAYNGQLVTLKWLRRNGYKWDRSTLLNAIYSGHINVVKWSLKWGLFTTTAWKIASINNRVEILQLLHDFGYPFINKSTYAAQYGNYEVLAWMQKNGYEIHNRCDWYMVRNGIHVDAKLLTNEDFQYERENLYKDKKFTQEQKEQKMINTLKWLKNTNYVWGSELHHCAIYVGNLPVINWLHDNLKILVWNEDATQWTRKQEVLEWIIQRNYKFDIRLSNKLAKSGHHKLLEWVVLHGNPTDIWVTMNKISYNVTHFMDKPL